MPAEQAMHDQKLVCPECGTSFVPDNPAATAEVSEKCEVKPRLIQAEDLHRSGENTKALGIVCILFGLVSGIAAGLLIGQANAANTSLQPGYWTAAAGASLIGLGFYFCLISHLLHIRGSLEK